ncbi:MAG: barstar family protein [Lachnospiraceae bacterium]|nr:barstar family protein [Lachnospiraceae bacterium]
MEIRLDFSGIDDKEYLHQYLKQQLNLPDYYGNNLDALHDCLTEKKSIRVITINHFEDLKAKLGNYADTLLQVFSDVGITVNTLAQ